MTKVCVICWNEVFPDGCAYYCKNDNNLFSKKNPSSIRDYSWLGPDLVFDTDKADVLEHYDEPAVGVLTIES